MSKVSDDTKARLQKQIEFYFGDSNVRDRWLRAKLKEDPEEYLPFSVLLSFNRVKEICPDLDVMVEVSERSKLLQVSDDKQKVKRATPWPDQDTSRPRTVYVKGTPPAATLDELLAFFGKHGTVNSVRFRRDAEKKRKDSVFVEFASEETAKKVAAAGEDEYTGGEKLRYETNASFAQRKRAKNKQGQKREERPAGGQLFAEGTVVRFSGIGTGLSRQALKEVFERHGTEGSVKMIDYEVGTGEGYVRLDNEVMAAFMVEKMEKEKVAVDGKQPTLEVLQGQAFKDYLDKMTLLHDLKNKQPSKKHKQQKRQGQKEAKAKLPK